VFNRLLGGSRVKYKHYSHSYLNIQVNFFYSIS
jgi:hypothetical protein